MKRIEHQRLGGERMEIINPYWAAAAAMGLYMNTVDLLGRIKEGQPTNGNALIGSILAGYVVFSLLFLCGR